MYISVDTVVTNDESLLLWSIDYQSNSFKFVFVYLLEIKAIKKINNKNLKIILYLKFMHSGPLKYEITLCAQNYT